MPTREHTAEFSKGKETKNTVVYNLEGDQDEYVPAKMIYLQKKFLDPEDKKTYPEKVTITVSY